MTQLRSQSRTLWNENINKWFKTLSPVKRTISINLPDIKNLKYLTENHRFAMFKIILTLRDLDNIDAFYEF